MTEREIDDVLGESDDDAAPYGRFKNGNARKRPARGSSGRAPRSPAAPGKKRTRKSTEEPDYNKMGESLAQMGGALLGIFASVTHRPAFALDSATLFVQSEQIGESLGEVAREDARMARWLESMTRIGPWGPLMATGTALAAQMMVNHGRLKAGVMQTLEPDELMKRAQAMAEKAAT